jgi:ComF family protein
MAERMARLAWPPDVVRERAMLVPVPLGAGRLRSRGYNQSERLATALGARWRVPVINVLTRKRETESQTRLTPGDRLSNVSGAFGVCQGISAHAGGGVPLVGRHVVLVDDVVTTAATLNSCAAVLTEGGARIISYVTFGRARAAGDRQ